MQYKLAVLSLVVFGLIGCGGGRDNAGEAPAGEGQALTGAVRIDGSSTVYPITEAVAEEFMREQPDVRVTVGVSGTGGGFAKFLRGETDISDASRPIKASELALAQQNNITYIELPVAYDGLAVVANPQNDWADCLTVEELNKIWAPGSKVNNWSQVREGFPNRPIVLYGPGTDSGTYDYFTEAINGEGGASRTDFTASEDDNVLVQGIAGDPNALGFFGLAYFEENQDKLKLLGVDPAAPLDAGACVQPATETVNNGTYQPLSRPLFIYVRADRASDPAIGEFVRFYLNNAGELAGQVGYVGLSQEAYDLSRARFEGGTTGTVFEEPGANVGVRLEDLLKRERAGETGPTE